jgi:hypothetical protein
MISHLSFGSALQIVVFAPSNDPTRGFDFVARVPRRFAVIRRLGTEGCMTEILGTVVDRWGGIVAYCVWRILPVNITCETIATFIYMETPRTYVE